MGDVKRPDQMTRAALEMEVAHSRVTIAHLMFCTAVDPKDQQQYRDRYAEAWAECERLKARALTEAAGG